MNNRCWKVQLTVILFHLIHVIIEDIARLYQKSLNRGDTQRRREVSQRYSSVF